MSLTFNLKYLYRALKYRYRNDKDELNYIVSNLDSGMSAIDVGAHKGGYLYWMSKSVGKQGKIFAFEPQPKLHQYLSDAIREFPLKNVELTHGGVSSSEGSLDLFVPSADGKTSPGATLEKREDTEGYSINVPVYQLDTLMKDRSFKVGLIKVDVEGHELEVFKGALELIKKDRPKIIFECEVRHLGSLPIQSVFSYLEDLGYRGSFFLNGSRKPLEVFRPEIHQQTDEDKEIIDKKNYANNFVFEYNL